MAEVVLPEIRLPWHNPHERPSDAMLIAHYPEALPELVTNARAAILAAGRPEGQGERADGMAEDPAASGTVIVESLAWHGLPWRWSWSYAFAPGVGKGESHRALAYLIPAVAAPEICVPLTYDLYEAMPKSMATTFVRQGITVAREIGDCRWVEWTITQPAHLDEVVAVIRHKAALLAGGVSKSG